MPYPYYPLFEKRIDKRWTLHVFVDQQGNVIVLPSIVYMGPHPKGNPGALREHRFLLKFAKILRMIDHSRDEATAQAGGKRVGANE